MLFSIRYCSVLFKTLKWCSETFGSVIVIASTVLLIDYSSLCTEVSAGRLRVVDNDCLLAEPFVFLLMSKGFCLFRCRQIRSLFVCLFVVVSVCPSVWLSVSLSVQLFLCLSVELID